MDVIAAGISALQTPGLCRAANLAVCLDARRGKIYARSYAFRKKGWIPGGPASVLSFEEMLRQIPKNSLLAGDGIPKIDARGFGILPEKSWHPRAAGLIELFEAGSPLLKKLASPRALLPFYLRSSEAEERLKSK